MITTSPFFWPWAHAKRTEPVPVNVRTTPRPTIICVRQGDIDRARLRELAYQCECLCDIRGGFPQDTPRDDPMLDAAIAVLDKWELDNGEELAMLLNTVKVNRK